MLPSAPHVYTYSRDKHILRCPWHGWEFDMATGQTLFDPERTRVKVYPVIIEDGMIVVYS
jgi:3-phenylpropionate/trans-cinnamate dioxygenase ferredoxin subunit